MRESLQQLNSQNYNICSICNKTNLIIEQNNIKNFIQKEKLKEIFKYNQPSALIKKCYCKNLTKLYCSDNDIYSHKYCILLKVIFEFEIRCENCNKFYNIKIDKKMNLQKTIYLFAIFIFIYIIHIVIYILIFFIDKNSDKNSITRNYKHLKIFFGIVIFIINTIFLYFTIINNIQKYKHIFNYKIYIFDINTNNKYKNKYFQLLYDYYEWFYDITSIKNLINTRHKKFIINNRYYNYNTILKMYIKENNKEYNNDKNMIRDNKNDLKEIKEDSIKENNENNEITLDNYLKLKNNLKIKNNNEEIDNLFFNQRRDSQIEKNKKWEEDLYSDKTDNNNEEEENKKKNNIIDMISPNKFKKDYINININPIQANNINININFHESINNNNIINPSSNKDILRNIPKFFHYSSGKTALIPNKNYMRIIDDNTYKNYLKQRRQIKSIKLKQKDIQIKDTKISGDIQENEEIDFSEFSKGKMDSKLSKVTKDNKIFFLKNIGSGTGLVNELFKTKKSFKDVPLNISNPTESLGNDSINNNNRFSFKNNIINKNANFHSSNSNIYQFSKK